MTLVPGATWSAGVNLALPVPADPVPPTVSHRDTLRLRGFAVLETVVALPALLMTGLLALQFGLVLHARQAVMHSATEGVRSGAVGHAQPAAIEQGLARGLSPWFHGAEGGADHRIGIERTRAHLNLGQGAGWVHWRQLSPTERSFEDWAVPSLDEDGLPIEGTREIPTDNLLARSLRSEPRSGRAPLAQEGNDAAPIGLASGQTLADANLLKIEFTYGVPLAVPLAGRLAAWVMREFDGCGAASGAPQTWRCVFYAARDATGRVLPRWPVRVAATARLQQPARHAGAATDEASLPAGERLGNSGVLERPLLPTAVGLLNPGGTDAGGDGSSRRDPGFLRLGGQSAWPTPGVCLAP